MTTMYSLRTIINHEATIALPMCMYKMKNINGNGDSNEKCTTASKVTGQSIELSKVPSSAITALETRQEKILEQLTELQQQVFNLYSVLKDNDQSKSAAEYTSHTPQVQVSANLVINANPSRPCYSILALSKLWSDVDFVISPYTHSNVKSKNVNIFKKTLPSGKASIINLSLMWKEVIDMEVITSGIHGNLILSESNFLRYLMRIFNSDCYENSQSTSTTIGIDRILDLSYELIHQESPKNRHDILILLNQILISDGWFSGNSMPEISDVAIWSAIKQSSIGKLPNKLTTWYAQCENTFLN